MRLRRRSFQSVYRSVTVLVILIALAVAWSGAVAPDMVHAEEPAATPATPTAVAPIDVSKLEIKGIEKTERGPYLNFLWSPDGTKALVSKTGAGHQLHRSQREGATAMEGLWVGTRDLWVVDWASGKEEQLAETAFKWAWSPDGSAVAYIAPVSETGVAGELYVLDLTSKSAQRIADVDIVQSYDQPYWLPTNEIVFINDGHLWSVQPDGSDLHQLNELHLNHIIPEGAEELAAYNGGVRDFVISANGKYIAYHTNVGIPDSRDYRAELWVADLDGQNARVIDENGIERSWSPDGESLAYLSQPDWEKPYAWNLAVLDAESGERHVLYESPSYLAGPTSITWSPGSDALVFREDPGTGEDPYTLWIAAADGSEHKAFQDVEVIQSPSLFMSWEQDGPNILLIPGMASGGGTPWQMELGAES